jgi:hypothetical protein
MIIPTPKKFRHEFKYYISYHEMIALRAKLVDFLNLDHHSITEEGYNIRSVYFDSPFDHALHDKNDGIFLREKYRIRCYNNNPNFIRIERKSKFGDFIAKESVLISHEQYEKILHGDYEWMKLLPESLVQDFYFALQYRHFKPTAIVDYWREAYIYEEGNVRITFDKNLISCINGFDLFDDRLTYESVLHPEQTILEVKFDQFLPSAIHHLIYLERFSRSSISKYVLCREKTIQYFK